MLRFILLAIGVFFLLSVLARVSRGLRNLAASGVACPHCSAKNPSGVKLCRSCGKELSRKSRVPEYSVED
jgi:ribosomal protein L40E